MPQAATLAATVAMVASAATALAVLPGGPPATAAPRVAVSSHAVTLKVGTITLRRCAAKPLTFCGRLAVPLDYSSAASPRIRVGFRWLPATGNAAGTILAVEGGPGYASTGSESLYRAMAGRLHGTRNLLLIDLRGTGTSTPVKCPGLEHAGSKQYGRHFGRLVAACGALLNHTWHYRDGGWVHASDLFNSAYSARDTTRVLRALRLGRVDLYGDSYGSWFAQVFASRYPGRLRSVTLDSTYQVLGLDPWYTATVLTARRAFAQACGRSAACATATRGGRAWARIGALARRLARRPASGPTTTASGTPGRLTVTPLTLVNLVNNAGFDPVVYQDLDAAARALLQHEDAAPLLRLAALSLGYDDTNESLPGFSDGLYFAVSCTDYVQLFDRSSRPAVRHRQYRAALRRQPAGTFAPFSLAQWTSVDQYTEAYSACLDWPAPVHHLPPITERPPLVPPRLPALILSGSLDSLTPRLRGATLVARQMGHSARLVTLANLTHVTEQDGDSGCARSIYQRFVQDPGGLPGESTSCAGQVAPIHTVGSYPRRLADVTPASPRPGNQAGRQALRAATAALASVGDEVSRWPLLSGNQDLGLRGGRVTFSGGTDLKITLRRVQWVSGALIEGNAIWDQSSGWVTARLTVHPDGGAVVRLSGRWQVFGRQRQPAVIHGSQGGRRLAAQCPAP